MSMHSIGQTKN